MHQGKTKFVVDLVSDPDNLPFSSIADFLGSELRLMETHSDGKVSRVQVFCDQSASFVLQVETKSFRSQTYKILQSNGQVIFDVCNSIQLGFLRHAYLADSSDSIRVTNNAVFVADSVPLQFGVAIALYLEAYS